MHETAHAPGVSPFTHCNVQEAEIEEDVEATRVIDWDTAAADTAYRAKVEEAEARQRLLLEQRAREVGHCAAHCSACYALMEKVSSVANHPSIWSSTPKRWATVLYTEALFCL